MDATNPASAHAPASMPSVGACRVPAELAGQLAAYGIDDPQWLPTLLAALARGGCVLIERTGDMLILPGA